MCKYVEVLLYKTLEYSKAHAW